MIIIFWSILILMTIAASGIALLPLLRPWKIKQSKTSFFILLLFPLFAFTLYHFFGASQSLEHYWVLKREASIVKKELIKIKHPSQIISRLKIFLQLHPNHPKGWYLLGRLYLGMKEYHQATISFKKAYQLKPNNITYAVAYAEALFFNQHQQLTPRALDILHQVLSKQPLNVAAINLLAINSYLEKNYQQAIHYWEKLISILPPKSADSAMVLSMIGRAEKKLAKVRVEVNLKLSARLKKKINLSDILYLYAKEKNGSGIPLAVIQRKVKHFPLSITLSSANSMIPGHSLTIGQNVEIIAHVSKSGSINFHKNDLKSDALTLHLKKGLNHVSLVIDRVIK